ncbi:hypothetical protein ACFVZ8_21550, partial [Streptomyces sp. NPDC059558]
GARPPRARPRAPPRPPPPPRRRDRRPARGPVSIRTHVVAGAWERFEAGDTAGYLARVAEAAGSVTGADVIVLAQASMAGAADLVTGPVPVLSSPAPGLAAGLAMRSAP